MQTSKIYENSGHVTTGHCTNTIGLPTSLKQKLTLQQNGFSQVESSGKLRFFACGREAHQSMGCTLLKKHVTTLKHSSKKHVTL